MADAGDSLINDPSDARIPPEYRGLQYWKRGFTVAMTWYHEEWDGGEIQLALARDVANAIAEEVAEALSDYL